MAGPLARGGGRGYVAAALNHDQTWRSAAISPSAAMGAARRPHGLPPTRARQGTGGTRALISVFILAASAAETSV